MWELRFSLRSHGGQADAPVTVFPALDDDNVDVRRNVYEALANASTTGPGEAWGWGLCCKTRERDSLISSLAVLYAGLFVQACAARTGTGQDK